MPLRASDAPVVGILAVSKLLASITGMHSKVPMTQDRYMSRGRVHSAVAALLDRAVKDE
jgi:hypothetical protein